MEQLLKQEALKFVGDKAWTGELALRLGAALAQAVNKSHELSGRQKSELVCQTILALLDDAEKAGKVHAAESTEKVSSTIHLDEIRNIVRNHLPVTLNLIVSAARGEFDFAQAQQVASGLFACLLPYLPCRGASAIQAVQAVLAPAPAAAPPAVKETPQPATATQPSAAPEPPKVSEIQEAAPASPEQSRPLTPPAKEPENV